MGRFNSLLIHCFSGRAWRKLQTHVLVTFIHFRLSWEGAGWEEAAGGEEGEEWAGSWSTHQGTREMSPRKLSCRKGKRGAGFHSLVSKRRQEKNHSVNVQSSLPELFFFPLCKHRGHGPRVLPRRERLVN